MDEHATRSSESAASGPDAGGRPGPLVSVGWLAAHLDDADLRLVHVSVDRAIYSERHLPGAAFADLHRELAHRGVEAATGAAEREWLIPPPPAVEAALRAWGVGPGDRVVFYDDEGQNRHAARGVWLLRLYGWPRERVHLLDGGLAAWERSGGELTAEPPGPRQPEPVSLPVAGEERRILAELPEVLEWSGESTGGGPIRILDVRSPAEYRGDDVRARRGGRIPGAALLEWKELLGPDGTFRPPHEIRALADAAAGGDARSLRAAHCQGGVRAALAWFALSELAGLDVANYAASWEEWGNRDDVPVETGPPASR